ncbi:MAG: hypothetical protein PF495_09190 [Spirochaetales bacterium]|jgi:hypothetical protein|nr:hypothetical protein [Spirochaetales bacterium]
MQTKVTSQFITALSCLFLLSTGTVYAEQENAPLCFSPIIIVDTTPVVGSDKTLLMQPYAKPLKDISTPYLHNPNELGIGDLDDYSLALGATLYITDRFNVGAACGVPLNNEETIQVEDISIEAMVTMQF